MLFGAIEGPDLIIVIVVVAVLVFGGSAIPKLARNLGSAKNEFEKGLKSAKMTDNAPNDSAPTNGADSGK
jgi:sec-independent protein translocase protein TatA